MVTKRAFCCFLFPMKIKNYSNIKNNSWDTNLTVVWFAVKQEAARLSLLYRTVWDSWHLCQSCSLDISGLAARRRLLRDSVLAVCVLWAVISSMSFVYLACVRGLQDVSALLLLQQPKWGDSVGLSGWTCRTAQNSQAARSSTPTQRNHQEASHRWNSRRGCTQVSHHQGGSRARCDLLHYEYCGRYLKIIFMESV